MTTPPPTNCTAHVWTLFRTVGKDPMVLCLKCFVRKPPEPCQ